MDADYTEMGGGLLSQPKAKIGTTGKDRPSRKLSPAKDEPRNKGEIFMRRIASICIGLLRVNGVRRGCASP